MDTELQKLMDESVGVRGFFRVRIVEESGEIVGDSGWQANQITNLGFNQYLVSVAQNFRELDEAARQAAAGAASR